MLAFIVPEAAAASPPRPLRMVIEFTGGSLPAALRMPVACMFSAPTTSRVSGMAMETNPWRVKLGVCQETDPRLSEKLPKSS
jgi:hypothetical protein